MLNEQTAKNVSRQVSRCDEKDIGTDHGKLSLLGKQDAGLKTDIANALWKDVVLRALDYDEISIRVKNGVVHLDGHIVSTTSQSRIMNAIRTLSGILETRNNLVLDDGLTLEVASSLSELEHTYSCKFFTGVSHGVVSLNGNVSDENVKLLAEKHVAANSKVRGVINNVRVLGVEPEKQAQPLLQLAIGESVFFSDWLSGVVKQVIINPNNRRVIAMTMRGKFRKPRYDHPALSDQISMSFDELIIVPIERVRYLTKTSVFLHIKSDDKDQYQEFEPAFFYSPDNDWVPPYPYCPGDVLFPVKYTAADLQGSRPFRFASDMEDSILREQLLVNDSLGR